MNFRWSVTTRYVSSYTRDNIYLQVMSRLYYHDPDDELTTPIVLGLIALMLGGWWGIVHLIDWATVDVVVWWAEPFTIVPVLLLFVVRVKYGRNPLHWWPLVWGVRIEIPDGIIFHMNYDPDQFLKRYGGPGNVFAEQYHVTFRRRKDAVTFCLLNL